MSAAPGMLLPQRSAMMRFRTRVILHTSLLASLVAARPVSAVVTRWDTNSSGDYNVASNWDTGVPGADDMAVFARGSGETYRVTFPGNLFIDPPAVYRSDLVLIDSNHVSFVESPQLNRGPSTYAIGTQLLVADFFTGAVVDTFLSSLSAPFAAPLFPSRRRLVR
jgi:hypothetical protein